MYDLIEQETKTLMLANARTEYAFTIVDPAVAPEVRIQPKRTLMALGGLVAGLLIALCWRSPTTSWSARRQGARGRLRRISAVSERRTAACRLARSAPPSRASIIGPKAAAPVRRC